MTKPPKVHFISQQKPTLEDVQGLVGGYIERVLCLTIQHGWVEADSFQMWCDEEGLLKEKLFNPVASAIAGREIVGDVVILTGNAILD
jgi:hypothetical protein